ncbi:MAG: hypothetical protein Q9209_002398 [Squamulea sp. 1 TL-2023]
MAFFNAGIDENGEATLNVSPLVWYFPAITIPITVLVFGVWEIWRRKRQAKITPAAGQSGNKEGSDVVTVPHFGPYKTHKLPPTTMHRRVPTIILLLLSFVNITLQVDVIINLQVDVFTRSLTVVPMSIVCRNLLPGVCCRRIWISYNDGATSHQVGRATDIEFRRLLPGDIAAVWERSGGVSRPRNGNDCSTRVLQTRHGPGRFLLERSQLAVEPGGGSYISVGQMKLPPDATTASALLVEGILGLVWGGGQWFGSAAAQQRYGRGGLKPKVKRGILSREKGKVYAQPPPKWVYPDSVDVNGTEYTIVNDQDPPVYKDGSGRILDLATVPPGNG